MKAVDWSAIEAKEEGIYSDPAPGAYVAVICGVEDKEDKKYLLIQWDYAEGEYKGDNQDTFDRAGFWPAKLFKSYKPKALPFFKAFKTALEESNPGYQFRADQLQAMVGRRFGVVTGEEEYQGNDGTVKKRLYVAQTRSLEAIRKGDYTVPALKKLKGDAPAVQASAWASTAQSAEENDELPF